MIQQQGAAQPQAEQSPQAGQHRQQEAPQAQGPSEVLAGHGVSRHARDGHGDQHRRGHDPGIHRRVAHHQAAQDGHRGPDGGGQAQPRLLQHLEGEQKDQHLKHGGEGHLLLGGDDGQGQLYRDGLGVIGDQGDIQPGHQQGHSRAQVAHQTEHRGQQPVIGPVLPGLEKLVHGARQQIAQGQPVAQQTHPALQQALTEAVGPLGVGHEGEGGVHPVGDVLLDVPRRLHAVDVDVVQPRPDAGHGVRVGDAVKPQHVHRRQGLPPHDVLPDLQLRGAQAAAHQRGVGAHALYKGVPGPLQGRLVLRLAHGALLLRGHGHHHRRLRPLRQEQGAGPVDQGQGHLVHLPLRRRLLGVQRPPGQQGQQLRRLRPGQLPVLGQGAEHIVVDPLRLGHPRQPIYGDLPLRRPRQPYLTLLKIGAAVKDLLQALRRQGQGEPRLPSGVGALRPPGRLLLHAPPSFPAQYLPGEEKICREIQRWDPPGASRHPPFTRGALRAGEDTAPYKKARTLHAVGADVPIRPVFLRRAGSPRPTRSAEAPPKHEKARRCAPGFPAKRGSK